MMAEMKIKAIAPWFGGKRNLAGRIIEALGPHRAYWEPFCGSMAVLLNKKPCPMETVNDLHGDLINLARVLQAEDTAVELYGRLSRTLMCEQLFLDAAQRCKDRQDADEEKADVDRAYDYFVWSWLGRNGTAGTDAVAWRSYSARFTSNGGHSGKRWRSAIESIPAWHERLLEVTILRRDGFEVIERIEDKKGTVIYCDPPYLDKGAQYVHKFGDGDHQKLAEMLGRFRKTRVVLSYYDDPRLQELYPGWTAKTFEITKSIAHQGRRGRCDLRAVEVLLINERPGASLF
jgi:DNA adenine methylase